MNHEELLSIMDNYTFKDSAEPVNALRAVIELHKPKKTKSDLQFCNYCRNIDDWKEVSFVWYPCPTIEVIEAELNR